MLQDLHHGLVCHPRNLRAGQTVPCSAGHHATALSARHALRLAEMPGPSRAVARAALRFIDAAAAVHRTQGFPGFYAGVLPNILQVSCVYVRI
jgi:hypothetical protein